MEKLFIVLLAGVLLLGCQPESQDEPTIKYDVRFPNVEHNEAEITVTLDNLLSGPVTLSMSRTSPGRYALHEFAKNVYDVSVTNGEGDSLEIHRPDLHNWMIREHDGTIEFRYTLYGRRADGTYTGINEKHAHMNIPATFVWVPDLPEASVTIQFHPPENANWDVATQLKSTDNPYTFTAPDYYYFLDSPTELSDFTLREWEATGDTADQKIQLAVHHNGTEEQVDRYTEMAQKVVDEQIAIYGGPPDFEYDTYIFIADYLPYVYGDGMEHRNSTILTSQRPLDEDGALQNLGTLSHEFFHSWNVERLRPETLEPFDFMNANVSDALWFAEGFTSYYDDLTIRRAGIISNQKYAQDWSGTLDYVLNSPGNQFNNPLEMSMQAPFVDAATSVDAQNRSNTFISYYSWGAVLGLGLDLELRTTFEDVTLDDFMRRMWEEFGKPEESYTVEDLENTLAAVTDSTEFAEMFFENHIHSGEHIDLEPLLAEAGFQLQKAHPGEAAISFGSSKINYEGGEATISQNTQIGSPLYEAGLNVDDVILSLDGQPINNARDMQRLLASHTPGDELSITYSSLGEEYESTITLDEKPELELLPFEEIDKELTDEMKMFRQEWLGSKVRK